MGKPPYSFLPIKRNRGREDSHGKTKNERKKRGKARDAGGVGTTEKRPRKWISDKRSAIINTVYVPAEEL
jgi:hypothetical protein